MFGMIRYVLTLTTIFFLTKSEGTLYSNTFVLESPSGNTEELKRYLSDIFSLEYKQHIHTNFYLYVKRDLAELLEEPWLSPTFVNYARHAGIQLTQEWYEKISRFNFQSLTSYSTSDLKSSVNCDDWNTTDDPLTAIGVKQAWRSGLSGEGIVVAVVDNGVELNHVDLQANVRPDLSFDFIYDIQDGNARNIHSYPDLLDALAHGTKCSGLIASVKNQFCSTGAAPSASIASLIVIESVLAVVGNKVSRAFSYKKDVIDVYSNSWGIDDDECGFSNLPDVTQSALDTGIRHGRNGKGSIYVFPSGNGGAGDNCNADGYANNINTITIGAANLDGTVPHFAEPCACALAVVPVNGNCLTTTTLNNQCTTKFVGTSASTAIAAGIFALVLESNPKLTKRDIENIIVDTADPKGKENQLYWKTNGAGKRFHDYFGFGQLNVKKMVEKANHWKHVPPQKTCRVKATISRIRHRGRLAGMLVTTSECEGIDYLEYIQIETELRVPTLDHLTISLTSPMKTRGELMSKRHNKCVSTDIRNFKWTFTSSQFWGENPIGKWKLLTADGSKDSSAGLLSATLVFYGYSRNRLFITDIKEDIIKYELSTKDIFLCLAGLLLIVWAIVCDLIFCYRKNFMFGHKKPLHTPYTNN